MVSDIEKMMVDDLRGMIKKRAARDELDSEITSIDAKLSEAIALVPEFPLILVFCCYGCPICKYCGCWQMEM